MHEEEFILKEAKKIALGNNIPFDESFKTYALNFLTPEIRVNQRLTDYLLKYKK